MFEYKWGEKRFVSEIALFALIYFIFASIIQLRLFPFFNLIGIIISMVAMICNAPESRNIDDGDDMGFKPNKPRY